MKLSIANLQNNDNGDPNPLLKAKLPISIFNRPFTSTVAVPTNSFSDLFVSLSTNFPSGPSLKLTYTPSTTASATATNAVASASPFSLSLKSGLGLSGSPRNSPLVFSANLSFSSASPSVIIPTFSLHFRPQFGHFSLHKKSDASSNPKTEANCWTHFVTGSNLSFGSPSNSDFGTGVASDGSSGWQEVKLEPYTVKEKEKERFANANHNDIHGVYSHDDRIEFGKHRRLVQGGGEKGGIFSGFAVRARTIFPLSRRLMVNLRWAMNLPCDMGTKMPYLTINKIGIERIEVAKEIKDKDEDSGENLDLLKGMCFWMARDLEVMEKENKDMKQCLEDLKLGVRSLPGASNYVGKNMVLASSYKLEEFEQRRNQKNDGGNGKTEVKKQANLVTDLESELQRALKAAAS